MSDENTTNDYLIEYFKASQAVELEMEPYKEQKRELKKEYLEKKWLSKEDISLSVRALRLLKEEVDIGALIDMYDALKSKTK